MVTPAALLAVCAGDLVAGNTLSAIMAMTKVSLLKTLKGIPPIVFLV
jgi:hypothetical protein